MVPSIPAVCVHMLLLKLYLLSKHALHIVACDVMVACVQVGPLPSCHMRWPPSRHQRQCHSSPMQTSGLSCWGVASSRSRSSSNNSRSQCSSSGFCNSILGLSSGLIVCDTHTQCLCLLVLVTKATTITSGLSELHSMNAATTQPCACYMDAQHSTCALTWHQMMVMFCPPAIAVSVDAFLLGDL